MPIRSLHLSTVDTKGGAARAAHRLYRALVQSGHDSTMPVLYKETEDHLVVAFDIGAMRELVFPSVNGWLASAGDAQDLASTIEAAIEAGEGTHKTMGEQGREHVAESFSFASVARSHAALYETLIEEANFAR